MTNNEMTLVDIELFEMKIEELERRLKRADLTEETRVRLVRSLVTFKARRLNAIDSMVAS